VRKLCLLRLHSVDVLQVKAPLSPVKPSSTGFFYGKRMIKFTSDIKIKFDTKNIEKQATFAMAKTLTQIATLSKDEVRNEMGRVFDRPTPFTLSSLFVKPAKRDALVATMGVKDQAAGKSTRAPSAFLKEHFFGGRRTYKKMEGAFRRAGMLKDDQMIVPGGGAQLDAFGNVSRGLIVQLISYFGAFGEQGYKANATAASKKRRAKFGKVVDRQDSTKKYKTIRGVVYFYSPGPGMVNGKMQHLPAGIWQKKGLHGVDISPVLLFVKPAGYSQKIDIQAITQKVHSNQLEKLFSKNFKDAMSSAR
jgi:hypothetical protein